MDSQQISHVYFVGIQGVGMASLAQLCKSKGLQVRGSDTHESFQTGDVLHAFSIPFISGFDEQDIRTFFINQDIHKCLVVYTGAHGGSKNPQVQSAQAHGLKTMPHAEALAFFIQGKKTIAVAGTHGKTTTAAMISHILVHAGSHPTYAVGTPKILGLLSNAGTWGSGDIAVVEADEYCTEPHVDMTPRFHYLHPTVSVITSIDYDHPDVYGSIQEVITSFGIFANKTAEKIILCTDDPNTISLASQIQRPVITYGFSTSAEFVIHSIRVTADNTSFTLNKNGSFVGEFNLTVPGNHNVLNATASIIASIESGIDIGTIKHGLLTFSGTKRRLEQIKSRNGITYYDDYAHHPTEIKASLAAMRTRYPGKAIRVVFQPHTYSRTKSLLSEFSRSFSDADDVYIAPIFSSSRETNDSSISSEHLVDALRKENKRVHFVSNAGELVKKLGGVLCSGDILITMGAGDIYTWQSAL